jgi:glycosyltransferase involved in cell wall biosynthesis
MDRNSSRIAIVADWLTNRGGAEKIVENFAEMFPNATIFTSVYNENFFPKFKNKKVKTSFLQKLPQFLRRKHQFLLPMLPKAFEKLDLSDFDLIISSSSAFAKCVKKTRNKQAHICYCHTPTRYLYHAREEYLNEYPVPWFFRPGKLFLPHILNQLEKKDFSAAQNVDFFISNSDFVGKRISKFYNRESETIYPGEDLEKFFQIDKNTKRENFFFAAGRFIPYKKFDLLIKTFAKSFPKENLKLAGIGPDLEKCKKLVKKYKAKNIEFLGFVAEEKLIENYVQARAFLFPAIEDFGLTPVEAMAAGTPVIAIKNGGVQESVVADCGVFFDFQTSESLQKGILEFIQKEKNFDREKIQTQAQNFTDEVFKKNFLQFFFDKKLLKI